MWVILAQKVGLNAHYRSFQHRKVAASLKLAWRLGLAASVLLGLGAIALVLDQRFPRSVMHCLQQAERSLYEISGKPISNGYTNKAEKQLSKLRSEVEFSEIEDVFDIGLHEYLDGFQKKLNTAGDAVSETYFAIKPLV